MRALVIASLAALMATSGCFGSQGAQPKATATDWFKGPVPAITILRDGMTWEGCVQYRSSLPADAAAYQKFVPKGFTLSTTDAQGRVVTLLDVSNRCAKMHAIRNGTTTTTNNIVDDFLVALPVTPPSTIKPVSGLQDVAVVSLYALGFQIPFYQEWHIRPPTEPAKFGTYEQPVAGIGRADRITIEAASDTFTHAFALTTGTTVYSKDGLRMWAATPAAAPTGSVRVQWNDTAPAAFGTVTLKHDGKTGPAPETWEGTTYFFASIGATFTYDPLVPS